MAGLYTTYQLLAVQRKMKRLPAFFLQWFNSQINFQEDKIAFDKVFDDLTRLAPFVAPNVQGKVIKENGYTAVAFKPAYVKPKHVVDPNMIIPRQPGEALGTGSKTLEQRRAAVISFLLQKHRAMHENTWEWMAAQALINGYVDVSGELYPTTRVDFRRDPSLVGTVDWTAAGYESAQTFEDIGMMKRLSAEMSVSGAVTRTIIMGGDAWGQFVKINQKTLYGEGGLMDKRLGGSDTSVTRMWDGLEGVEYMGRVSGLNGQGSFEIYVNTQKYRDENDQSQFLFPQNKVLGIADSVDGVRCFGAIMDDDANYQALEYFPKMWKNPDPSVTYLLTQGAPLMVPRDANATWLLTVMPAS